MYAGSEGWEENPLGGSDIWPEGASQKEEYSREKEQQEQRPWGRDKLACLRK